jgi:autotransporter-associated beta strand protein
VKSGTSTLAISNANDFTGPVTVNGATLRLANSSALGTSAGGLTVNPGAMLDVGGYSAGLDLVTIAGTGLNNTGAVINSGARSDNAIRLLVLAGDATVGTYGGGRWDVRGAGGSGSFSGLVDLGGYTLTSIGATQFSIVDSLCTNRAAWWWPAARSP